MSDPGSSSTYGAPHGTPDSTQNSNIGSNVGTRIKGAARLVHGFGESLRGSAMGLVDGALGNDTTTNTEITRKGSSEIQRGMAELKGQSHTTPTATTTTTAAPPSVGNPVYGGESGTTIGQQPTAFASGYRAENMSGAAQYRAPPAEVQPPVINPVSEKGRLEPRVP